MTELRFPDTVHRLQLGAGENVLAGWLNTDVELLEDEVRFLDATRPFPFPDGSVDYVLSEHHLEHLTYADGRRMLAECARVLRPGGRIRVATPDLGVLLGLYDGAPDTAGRRYVSYMTDRFIRDADAYDPVFVINNAFASWGHRFLYDRVTLAALLHRAGFRDVVFRRPGHSDDPQLRGVEQHGEYLGNEEVNAFETMVAEAVRPERVSPPPAPVRPGRRPSLRPAWSS